MNAYGHKREFVLALLLVFCWPQSPRIAIAANQEPQRWALLVGVNDYANVQQLHYCVADQDALAKQLIESGFPEDQVFLLTDTAEKQKFRPSKANIERQLELVLAMPAEGDTLVLSFSGHGVQIGGKSYICPADCDLEHPQASMIALDKVFADLSACKASLKFLIVDACRNEVEIGGKRAIDNSRSLRAFGESLEKPPEGISLLTSCSPGQFAREHDKLGHGVFIHFILEGLQGKAADEDGSVRLGRLMDYTVLKTEKYVHSEFNAAQRPYYKLEGSGAMEFCRLDRSKLITPLVAPFNEQTASAKQQQYAAALKRDVIEKNSVGIKLVLIPPGEFVMGSADSTAELRQMYPYADSALTTEDAPQHRVRITKPFYMGTCEVTLGQFLRFHDETGYDCECVRDGKGGWGYSGVKGTEFQQLRKFVPWSWGFEGQTQKHPVVNITWNDAIAFCEWLSKKENKHYHLPTEAQWEYAARAGTTTRFIHGNHQEGLAQYENVLDAAAAEKYNWENGIAARDGFAESAPVASFRPNNFGLYDMLGNVSEWCQDYCDANYYPNSPVDDPLGPEETTHRVVRGGCWSMEPFYNRISYRGANVPSMRTNNLGFRVICDP